MKFFKTIIFAFLFTIKNIYTYALLDNNTLLLDNNKLLDNNTLLLDNLDNNTYTYYPIINQYNRTTFKNFILFFVSYSCFYIFILLSIIIKKIFNLSYFTQNISYFNLSRESFIFAIVYFIWWCLLLIYSFMTKDKSEILFRLGLWISLNMGSVLIPITRNSIWIIIFNISYNHILNLHKFMSVLCLISVIVKLITVVIFYNIFYLFIPFNIITGGSPLMGTLSSLSILITSLSAIPCIRNNIFELFYYFHRFLAFFTILTGTLHYVMTIYYMLPSFILYIVDLILRVCHTHKAIYTHLKIVGDEKDNTSCVLIHITLLNPIKVTYGSYFFLCFKDISYFQWHPLSLISEQNENLIFCAKDRGKNTWTNNLKNYDSSVGKNILMNKDIYIQGPYGHVTISYNKNKYEYILTIAGGIGITPIISVLQDINNLYLKKKLNKMKKIIVIWIASHYSIIKPFLSLLYRLEDIFQINIYITKSTNIIEEDIPSCYNIYFEKPNISNIINQMMEDYTISKNLIATISCGPKSLSNEIIKKCSELNIDISNQTF